MVKAEHRPYLLLSPALLSLALFLIAPIIFIFAYSFWLRADNGQDIPAFQFGNWASVLGDSFYWLALRETFQTSALTTLICILVGYPAAYFLARCRFNNKALLLFLLFLPFWISYIIRTFAWINVLGKNGFVNSVLMSAGLIDEPMKLLYNNFSVIMGLAYFLLPYMIINVYVSLDGIDRNLESAARTLGCTPWQTFREVTLPLSLPGLGAGSLLCFVLAAGSFVTPRLLGGTDTLFYSEQIYDVVIGQLDWPTGSVLSLILLISLAIVVAVYNRFMSLSDIYRSFAKMSGAGGMSERQGLGWNALRLVTVCVYIFMFAPIIVVILLAFNSSRSGSFPMEGFSLQWFVKLSENQSIVDAFKTSLVLAATSSLLATLLGVMAALALIRYSFRGKAIINNLLSLPLLMPEVVLGVALLMFLKFLSMPRSFLVLLVGHTVLSLPYVVLVVQARLVGLRQHYEEAALSLGANRLQTFASITLPLIAPAVIGGFLFAATLSFDNITATLFWKKPGIETVPTKIFAMLRTSISPEINALGAVMIVITIALPLVGGFMIRRLSRVR